MLTFDSVNIFYNVNIFKKKLEGKRTGKMLERKELAITLICNQSSDSPVEDSSVSSIPPLFNIQTILTFLKGLKIYRLKFGKPLDLHCPGSIN